MPHEFDILRRKHGYFLSSLHKTKPGDIVINLGGSYSGGMSISILTEKDYYFVRTASSLVFRPVKRRSPSPRKRRKRKLSK